MGCSPRGHRESDTAERLSTAQVDRTIVILLVMVQSRDPLDSLFSCFTRDPFTLILRLGTCLGTILLQLREGCRWVVHWG